MGSRPGHERLGPDPEAFVVLPRMSQGMRPCSTVLHHHLTWGIRTAIGLQLNLGALR